jgi:hypothetical protein
MRTKIKAKSKMRSRTKIMTARARPGSSSALIAEFRRFTTADERRRHGDATAAGIAAAKARRERERR